MNKIRFNNRLVLESASVETMKEIYKTSETVKELIKGVPKGAPRAGWVYALIEQHRTASTGSVSGVVSCRAGCGACCHTKVMVNAEEADLLVMAAEKKNWAIDKIRLKIQKDFLSSDFYEADELVSRCVFLDDYQMCKIYEVRPMACRNLLVTTPAEYCKTDPDELKVVQVADLLPEVIAEAYDEVIGEKGSIAEMILDRIC